MELRLLGPVEVLVEQNPVRLGGRQRRTLLTILAVHADVPVSTEKLIDDLWGDSPPDAARKTVQAHIAHLRKALNIDGEVLTSADDGYMLQVDPNAIDVRRFESLVDQARQIRPSDPQLVVERLDEALALFRGAPLAGLADDAFSLRVEANRIEELRLAAVEDRLDAMISTGDVAKAAIDAERLVAEHPLRERLWGLLMLSLYRGGRQSKALQAFSRARQTLAEELGIEPSTELRDLEQRILDQDPQLDRAPTEIRSEAVAAVTAVRNPYKGLRAFDEADSGDFFGREDLVRRLLEKLGDRRASNLVVLAGPSGAGKSSAVRAGLVPGLRSGDHPVVVMFPGSDPLAALAKAVAEATGEAPGDLLAGLRQGVPVQFDGLVVIDQFEELFTMAGDPADVDRFLELIAGDRHPLRSVVTVRADFLDRILAHPRTGPILEDALLLVPPLQEHEVAAAVIKPAERVGVGVSPELVREIVRDVQTRPAALPLLQFALTDTFERRDGDLLAVADYERAGGISGALSRRADELYTSLDSDHQEATRQLLLNLVSLTEEGEEVRRRVERDSLLGLPAGAAVITKVIERLGAQRLLTFDQDPETGKATVEVAHEALIGEWPRLARWVDDAREDISLRQRLAAAAREWSESGKDRGFLLSGGRLALFSGWASSTDLDLTVVEREYVDASAAAEKAEMQKASRRRRRIVGGVATALLIAIGLGALAITQRQAAAEQARIVRTGDLAAAANLNLSIDPELSLLLALEATETTRSHDGSVLKVAEEALHRAVLNTRLVGRVTHGGEGIAHVSPDGRTFVTSGEDETIAQVWNLDPLEPNGALIGHSELVIDAVYDSKGLRIATTSFDGTVRVWEASSGDTEMVIDVPGAPPLIPAFSKDGSLLAASSVSGTTWVWDLDTGDVVWELPPPPGTTETVNLEFSPDGSLLAVAPNTEDDTVVFGAHVWDLASGELVTTLTGHQWDVKDIGFTPDGEHLLTASWDTTVKVWNVATWENERTFFGHQSSIWDFQISSDGTKVASSGSTEVLVWDLSTLEVLNSLVGHAGIVDGIDLTPDTDVLISSSFFDGTTRVWDLTGGSTRERLGLPGPEGGLGGVVFSPNAETLAASRGVGLVTLWTFPGGQEVQTIKGPGEAVDSITFDPEGRFLAVAGLTGVQLFDTVEGDVTNVATGVEAGDIAFSSTGLLATSAADGVRLWTVPPGLQGELLSDLGGYGVAFDPTGEIVVMSLDDGEDGFVEIRDVGSGELLASLDEHQAPVWRIEFSPDGSLFATAGLDSRTILWDAATFEPVKTLEGHVGQVFGVAFDPIRAEVATASDDGTIKIWDLETGAVRLILEGTPFSGVDYSPDGRYLAATGPEGFVTVFILDVEELVETAEQRLTRWWAPRECRQYLQSETCPDPPEDFKGSVATG